MAIYSIKDMEKLSGIKAHTLRIWEQRYRLLQPKRTDTNIRYYDDNDLRLLLNISLLNNNGWKISKIAKLNEEEILEKVAEFTDVNSEFSTQLDALTISTIEMDEFKFDKIISVNIAQNGFEKTMFEVILPFLEKLGTLWTTGSIYPVQENFISNLIRQKLISSTNDIPLPKEYKKPKFVLYLPKGEQQELSILFLNFLLKSRGFQVLYLGHDITVLDLKDLNKIHRPEFIFCMITETYTNGALVPYLQKLSTIFPDATLLCSGYQVILQEVSSFKNVKVLSDLDKTIDFIDKLK